MLDQPPDFPHLPSSVMVTVGNVIFYVKVFIYTFSALLLLFHPGFIYTCKVQVSVPFDNLHHVMGGFIITYGGGI